MTETVNISGINVANVSYAGANGSVPFVLSKSAIPFIGLSSGSVAANGAISGITALPVAYAAAYCWFPANALATVKAAGWYYCTFSTTTAGIAYLDSYTAGIPTIPSSPTPVTDGKGAFTGDTAELFAQTITVPANAMGTSGALRIHNYATSNSNANVKTVRGRWTGNTGNPFVSLALASQQTGSALIHIYNRATNVQIEPLNGSGWTGFGVANSSMVFTAVDTTVATTVVFSVQKATATDNLIVEAFTVELLP